MTTLLPAQTGTFAEAADAIVTVLLVTGALGLAALAAAGLAGWYLLRRVRRSRRLRQAREGAGLSVRAVAGDRSGRRLAALRLSLRRSAVATEHALTAARGQGRGTGELPAIAQELAATAEDVDRRLLAAERETDDALRRALVAALRPEVAEVERLGARLRAAAAGVAPGPAGRGAELVLPAEAPPSLTAARLTAVRGRLDVECEALRAWDDAYRRQA